MRFFRWWVWLPVMLSVLAGCSGVQFRNDVEVVDVTPELVVSTPGTTQSLFQCSENPFGLVLEVILGPKRQERRSFAVPIQITGRGYEPGESISFLIEGRGHGITNQIEGMNLTAAADGTFTLDEILPLDEPNMQWQVLVTGKRGVACTSFVTN